MTGITLGLIVMSLALSLTFVPSTVNISVSSVLQKFSSYSELKTFLNNSGYAGPYYYTITRGGQSLFLVTYGTAMDVTSGKAMEYSVDYSKTNIQVEGVDEADIVKSDGEYLYLASGSKILILKAYPADDAQIVAEIILNGTVSGLFVNGDRLVVFESAYQDIVYTRMPISIYPSQTMVQIKVYDIADRSNPLLVRTVSSDGWYFTSRMIGDYVYVIVDSPAYILEGEITLPIIIQEGGAERVGATDVYYMNVTDYSYGFTTVFAINIKDESVEPTHKTYLLGTSSATYASANNIYLAIPSYDYETSIERTNVVRIQVQGSLITSEATGQVPGRVLNQYSMDEYEGYFRIATTTSSFTSLNGQATSGNNVYVLNMNLTIVGALEDLAPGESIYSARFMGSRCYLVTFKKVDPLFVIGLDDPAAPRVLGRLKIPGFSDYLHPYSENLLIGVGKETVEAEEGDFAWYQGVKIALFDVSDVENPREVAKIIIGDRGTDSPVLSDPKAFLFDKDRNLLAMPILLAEINESQYPDGVPSYAYGEYVWQGLYVFTITEDSIALRGQVTHVNNPEEFMKSGYYYYSEFSVTRSLYIENMLYSISDAKVKISDLTSLETVKEIKLP
jgi:uncharacterized secreted protein with C-terminal beta-propeller domain